MGQPAAKQGDQIVATDLHIVLVPSGSGTAPMSFPHPFTGILNGNLSRDVQIMGLPAAIEGSTADNTPPHVPASPGAFQKPPANKGTVQVGSTKVKINGKAAAAKGDVG